MSKSSKYKIQAYIFARGGSKGLPGKNIKTINGKPLIGWAILQALGVKEVDSVIVSTDCDEIAKTAKKYGAIVPFMRPQSLSLDSTPEWLAWKHALGHYLQEHGCLPDVFVSVPTTSPLRRSADIDACIKEYLNHEGTIDGVVVITKSSRSPFFNMVKKDDRGNIDLVIKSNSLVNRRQDAPVTYDLTTVAYVFSPNFILKSTSIFDGKLHGVEVPLERSIDIDTQFDFEVAEFLMKKEGKN